MHVSIVCGIDMKVRRSHITGESGIACFTIIHQQLVFIMEMYQLSRADG